MSKVSKGQGPPVEVPGDGVPPPTGTIFVLSAYGLILVVMWVAMLFGLISR